MNNLGGNVEVVDDGLVLHWYYFPAGSKHVAYSSIKGLRHVTMTRARGKGRIWGTGGFGYWANLDVRRPKKTAALILDLGGSVKAFITPDDVPALDALIRQHVTLPLPSDDDQAPWI